MSTVRSKLLLSAAALAALAAAAPAHAAKVKLGTSIVEGHLTGAADDGSWVEVSGVRFNVQATTTAGTSTLAVPAGTATKPFIAWRGKPATVPNAPYPITGPGLIGTHSVVQGQVDASGVRTANDFFTDIEEAPVVGQITSVLTACSVVPTQAVANTVAGASPTKQVVTCSGNPLGIEGLEVVELPPNDPIMPGAPATTNEGFIVDPSKGIVPNTGVSGAAVGYVGNDGKSHAYDIQLAAGAPINAAIPEAAITRAICVIKDGKIDVRGGIHNANFAAAAGQTVTLFVPPAVPGGAKGPTIGTANSIDAGVTPAVGSFRFTGNVSVAPNLCPDTLVASFADRNTRQVVYSDVFVVTPR